MIGEPPELVERQMFGGIGFIVQGNMAVGVIEDELMVRIDKAATDQALEQTRRACLRLHRPAHERLGNGRRSRNHRG